MSSLQMCGHQQHQSVIRNMVASMNRLQCTLYLVRTCDMQWSACPTVCPILSILTAISPGMSHDSQNQSGFIIQIKHDLKNLGAMP